MRKTPLLPYIYVQNIYPQWKSEQCYKCVEHMYRHIIILNIYITYKCVFIAFLKITQGLSLLPALTYTLDARALYNSIWPLLPCCAPPKNNGGTNIFRNQHYCWLVRKPTTWRIWRKWQHRSTNMFISSYLQA